MPGGLLQLELSGKDFLINENNVANITHFKKVYRTYSNFSMQDLGMLFKTKLKLGNSSTLTIPNNGDLLQNLTLKIRLPKLDAVYNNDKLIEINIQKNKETYTLSANNIAYILERFYELLNNYSTITSNSNAYNWLAAPLSSSLVLGKKKKIIPDIYLDGNLTPITIFLKTVNLSYNYMNNMKQFYYPLNMQYLLHVLDNTKVAEITSSSYDLYQSFVSEINKAIVTTPALNLVKYIVNKQTNYSLTSLDNIYNSQLIKININFTLQTNIHYEPVIYCYRNKKLIDILINKGTSGNITMTTERYFNNTNLIEQDLSNNVFKKKIYYIASRYQVFNSLDLLQILEIKYIKSRKLNQVPTINSESNWDIVYTNDPNLAIEWEIKLLLDPGTLKIIPDSDTLSNPNNLDSYNLSKTIPNIGRHATDIELNRTKYLVYMYSSLSPEFQDITDISGNYITDNNQKQYFIDKNNNYISIKCYFQNINQKIKSKRFIPLINSIELQANISFTYNRMYFLDKDANFVLISEIYTDPDGNNAVLVLIPDPINPNVSYKYYVDISGNYHGPINSTSDISGNYIIDTTADFIIDLIGINTTDQVIQGQEDISRNLIPVFDFVNQGKSFTYIYKGKYYNYRDIFFKNPDNQPNNLVNEPLYLPPFCIMTLQTYHNDKIILRKLNLDNVKSNDYLYNPTEISIRNGNTEHFKIYGNKMYDNSGNIYTISNNQVYLNNTFKYYWNNTLIDPSNNITYTSFQYWQDTSISTNLSDDKQLILIDNINTQQIYYDVYQNYKYLMNNISSQNYQDYQIYNYLITNISTTVSDNYNILRNIFVNLFNENIFFSQYVATISTNIVLQTNFVTEHLNNFLSGIKLNINNNFTNYINNIWSTFKEQQDVLFLKTVNTITSSSKFIKLATNNLSVPCLKVLVNSINNSGLLQQIINIVYAANTDISRNPVDINLFTSNKLSNNSNIQTFIENNFNYDQSYYTNKSDYEILKDLNIFSEADLSLNKFEFLGWRIIDSDLDNITNQYTLYCVPPTYIEFKKLLLFQYITGNTQNMFSSTNSLFVIFNVSPNTTDLSLLADRVRTVTYWDYIFYNKPDGSYLSNADNEYINKTRSVSDSTDRIVYMNSIMIDLFRYLSYSILNKMNTSNIPLQIILTNNLWHLLQDILYFNDAGYANMNRLSLPGNILAINNFTNYVDASMIKKIISNGIENKLNNVKYLSIVILQNKSILINNVQEVRFYSIDLSSNFISNKYDIDLTNSTSIEVISWLVYYLAVELRTFFINTNDTSFWDVFNTNANNILTNMTLPIFNYFVYLALSNNIISNDNLKTIYYNVNEIFMNVYKILDNETITDSVNNVTYTLSASLNISSFGIIYNLNNFSFYDVLITFFNNYLNKLISNYTYSGVINYYTETKNNFMTLYTNIFNNINHIGLDTFTLYNEIQVTTGFNWSEYRYQLDFPRVNADYTFRLDTNLQFETIFNTSRIYYKYELMNKPGILAYIDNVINTNNQINTIYTTYKNILNINNLDQTQLLTNYTNTFGGDDAMYSNLELRRVIEWGLYQSFGNNNGSLKIFNGKLGFYDNNNNFVLNYAENVLYSLVNKKVGVIIKNNICYNNNETVYDINNNIGLIKINNRLFEIDSILSNQIVDSNAQITINNIIYDISGNYVYDFSGNIIYAINNNNLIKIGNLEYKIINNILFGTGIYKGYQLISKVLFDQIGSTYNIFYELDYNVRADHKLYARNLRSTFGSNNFPLIQSTLDNIFSNTKTITDIVNNCSYQLTNIDYTIPILLNLAIRNSLFSCCDSWENFLLVSSWNDVIVKNNYTAINIKNNKDILSSVQQNSLQYWNVTNQRVERDISNVRNNDIIQLFPNFIKYGVNSLTNEIVNIGTDFIDNQDVNNNIIKQNVINNLYNNNYITVSNIPRSNLPFGFSYVNGKIMYTLSYNIDYISCLMSYNKFNNFLLNRYMNIIANTKSQKIIGSNYIDIISISNQITTITPNIASNANYIYIITNNIDIVVNSYIAIYKFNDIYGPMQILDIVIVNNIKLLTVKRSAGFIYEENYDYKLIINVERSSSTSLLNYCWQDYFKQEYHPYKISNNIIDVVQDLSLKLNNTITMPLPDQNNTINTLTTINTNLESLNTSVGNLPSVDSIMASLTDISSSIVLINKNISYSPTLYTNLSNLIDVSNNMTNIIPFVNSFNLITTGMKKVNFTNILTQLNTIGTYAQILQSFVTQSNFMVTIMTNLNSMATTLATLITFYSSFGQTDIVATLTAFQTTLFSGYQIGDLSDNIVLFQQVADMSTLLVRTGDISNNLTTINTLSASWTGNLNNLNDFSNSIGNLNLVKDVSSNITNFFNIFNNIQDVITDIAEVSLDLSNNNINAAIDLINDTNNLQPIFNTIENISNLNGIINTFTSLGTTLEIFTSDITNILSTGNSNNSINITIIEELRSVISNIAYTNTQLEECLVTLNELSSITDITGIIARIQTNINILSTFFTILPTIATIARAFPSLESIQYQKQNNIPYTDLYSLYSNINSILAYFTNLYNGIQQILGSFNLTPVSPIITKLSFIVSQIQKFINYENLSIATVNIINTITSYATNNDLLDNELNNNKTLQETINTFTSLIVTYFIPLDYVPIQTSLLNLVNKLPTLAISNINIVPINNAVININNSILNLTTVQSIDFTIYNITFDEPEFFYIFKSITDFILYLNNIENLNILEAASPNGVTALYNTQIIANNLTNIYQMIYVIESLTLLQNILIDSNLQYKLKDWINNTNAIYGSTLDINTFIDNNDWVILDNTKMLVQDKYNIKFNNTIYTIFQLISDVDFVPSTTSTLYSGLGYILDINLLNDDIFFDVYNDYNKTIDYSLLISDYKYYSTIDTDVNIKKQILFNIINSIPDSSSLLTIFGDKISRQINHGFNNFRLTIQNNIQELMIDYNNLLSTKNNNIINLNIILNRPDRPRFSWINYIGHFIIKRLKIEINDFKLEELNGDWIHIKSLLQANSKLKGYFKLIGNTKELTFYNNDIKKETDIYIPLPFYFKNFPALALPLIALFNSEINLFLETNTIDNITYLEDNAHFINLTTPKFEILGRFIYLDGKERDLFGSSQHEYLIEQTQYKYHAINTKTDMIDLNTFFMPIKDMFFVYNDVKNIASKQYWNYTMTPYNESIDNDLEYNLHILLKYPEFNALYNKMLVDNPFYFQTRIKPGLWGLTDYQRNSLKSIIKNLPNYYPQNPVVKTSMLFNGHKRFKDIDGQLTGLVYPYSTYKREFKPGVNIYSFSLYPHEHSPSGAASFSYLNDKKLEIELSEKGNGMIKIFARSYNMLRIKSGLAVTAM